MKKIFLPLLLLAANVCIAQVNLPLGLRAYYPFSGNANDISGNNNNPVFNNATLTADRFGNPNSAYHFNGTTNYMQIPNSTSLNMPTKISVAFWVKPTGYYTGSCYNNMMVTKSATTTQPANFYVRFGDIYNGCTNPTTTDERFSGNNTIAPTPLVQLNQWYSVVWTSDGVLERIYVNCVLKVTAPASGVPFSNGFDMFFGKQNDGSFPYFLNGDLDEVRIYDRDLNQDEVSTLGGCPLTTTCNNWLRTQVAGQSVTVGDLDVSGNTITVEGNFNCTAFPPPANGNIWEEIVSKHNGTTDDNYSLRMNLGAITTTNGFFRTPAISCEDVFLNKTYHAAMVYDGSTLKFYRNGFLRSQVPATGNLVLNNWLTTIGDYASVPVQGTNFVGYLNEIRIWNVARTQAQIQSYMNASLPNPATQPGLLGYYAFDNLTNKQGNATWNGTLNGGATINNTNPNCTFSADSCAVTVPSTNISGVINDYTPILAFNICDNKLTVEDGTKFNTGDTVLMIQMKGAAIDSANTANFGTITDYKNAGNYEFNYVKSKVGNIIELKNAVTRQYDIPLGKVQLVRVPYYTSVNVTGTLTCLPWDGNKGGILVVNVRDTLSLSADVNTTGKGFLKGIMHNSNINTFTCGITDFYYPDNTINAAGKGEGITSLSSSRNSGKGPAANGGGGGMNTNSGGAGGSNGNVGGRGGYEWNGGCPNYLTSQNWGFPGKSLSYNIASNKIFLGGGGGAGHCNNQFDDPSFNADYNGGNGGGIILINADYVQNNGKKIVSKGDSAYQPVYSPTYVTHDGMGGGGGGGAVLLNANNYINNLLVDVSGGKGANMVSEILPGLIGPGGGGGGGVVWVKQNTLPANVTVTSSGGSNGVIVLAGNNSYGAASGLSGINVFSLNIPFTTTPFKKNIDSVRIKDSILICTNFDFKGLAYTNSFAVNSWQWSFGDGGTAASQNTTHNYISAGTYTVKLVVTDINGCKDSVSKNVTTAPFIVDAGRDTSICTNNTATVKLNASAGATYAWTPAAFLNNPAIQSPTATISATTRFYVTITNLTGCVGTDSVTISIAPPVPNIRYQALTAFAFQSLQLQARNLGGNSYTWLPATGLNNNLIINPVFSYNLSQEYKINITTAAGCKVTDTLLIEVKGKKGIYVPKAFSPNGDGTNDRLYPILVGIRVLNYFRVYNRWGNLVFETNSGNPAAGWNGKINGNEQPPETYTWTVEGIDIDGIVIKKSGNTFLVR